MGPNKSSKKMSIQKDKFLVRIWAGISFSTKRSSIPLVTKR